MLPLDYRGRQGDHSISTCIPKSLQRLLQRGRKLRYEASPPGRGAARCLHLSGGTCPWFRTEDPRGSRPPVAVAHLKRVRKNALSFHIRREGSTYKTSTQGITASVDAQGLTLEQANETWSVRLVVIGKKPFTPRTILHSQQNQNRIERKDGIVTEWYVNGQPGLEQGWTIQKRPHGTAPLVLSFRTGGTLQQAITKERITLTDARGTTLFTYGGLYACDADGASLPVRFEGREHGFALVLDDANARYPIVIDPFVQVARLMPSAGVTSFGFSVALSADGNTIVVGAAGTPPDEAGAVYVFLRGAGWANGTENAKLQSLGSPVALSPDGSTLVAYGGAVYVFLSTNPVDGQCGSSSGAIFTVAPTTDLCSGHSE